MRKTARTGLVVIAAIAAGGFLYAYYALNKAPSQQRVAAATQSNLVSAPERPGAPPKQHYPIPAPKHDARPTPPLPALADSDSFFVSALKGIFGSQPIDTYLVPRQVIRRIVATVDSLDRDSSVSLRLRPVPATRGRLIVEGKGNNLV